MQEQGGTNDGSASGAEAFAPIEASAPGEPDAPGQTPPPPPASPPPGDWVSQASHATPSTNLPMGIGWPLLAIVLIVGLVIAVGATGVGLLRTEADLEGGGLRAVQIAGVAVAIAGAVGLFLFRRRTSNTTSDPTLTALATAAVIMGVLALIALPTSPDLTGDDPAPEDRPEDGPISDPSPGGFTPPSGGSGGAGGLGGLGDLGSVAQRIGLSDALVYSVVVDPETGEGHPVVIDAETGRGVGLDTDTGELIPVSPGASGSGSDLLLPVVVDEATGEANIVVADPETGDMAVLSEVELDPSIVDEENFVILDEWDPSQLPSADASTAATVSEADFQELIDQLDSSHGDIVWDPDVEDLNLDDLDVEDFEFPDDPGEWESTDLPDVEVDDQANESGRDSNDSSDEDDGGLDFGAFFKGLLYALLVGAGVLAIMLLLRAQGQFEWPWKRKKQAEEVTPDAPPVDAADAEAGLEASLAIAQDTGDPRQQITAAYHRLLLALAQTGGARQPQEAPHEHLNRVLGPLGVRPEPVHQLAELYVMAQFSERPITDQHQAAAVTALEQTLTDLRAALPPPPPPDGQPTGPVPALSGAGSPETGGPQ